MAYESGAVSDYCLPAATLFGTTAQDILSAVVDRAEYLIDAAYDSGRISIIMHNDSAVAMLRAGYANEHPSNGLQTKMF